MIYFIAAGVRRGPVKIGYTDNLADRLRTLQSGNPQPLYALAVIPGDVARERRLHQRFAEGRLIGEWFDADTPGLDEFLSAAIHFEGFFPEDQDSELCQTVLSA